MAVSGPSYDNRHAVDCDSQPGGRGRGRCDCAVAEVERLRAGLEKIARDGDSLDCVIEARHVLWPPND